MRFYYVQAAGLCMCESSERGSRGEGGSRAELGRPSEKLTLNPHRQFSASFLCGICPQQASTDAPGELNADFRLRKEEEDSNEPHALIQADSSTAPSPPPRFVGGLKPNETPMFIVLTADDAVQTYTTAAIDSLVKKRQNPNGCDIKVSRVEPVIPKRPELRTGA